MGQLRVEVLGHPTVMHAGEELALQTKPTALVCYLAVTGQRHARSALAGLLWGELPEARARANLRMVLADLRRAVGPHVAITARDVGPGADWQVDLHELDELVPTTDGGAGAPGPSDHPVARVLARARNELLAGFDVPGAPAFDDWLLAERERLRRRVLDHLRTIAQASSDHDPELALALGRELLARDPLDEATQRLVMGLLAGTGRRAAALAQYETCRMLLAEELGVDPSPETVAVHDRLLREDGQQARAEPAASGGGVPTTRPRHRVQDLPAARVLQRLPQASGPLVGREGELERIRALLADDSCRLLTLVGPGGVGKTRLALAAAGSLPLETAIGAVFVPLAALPAGESVESVAGAIAHAVEAPVWRDSPLDALRRHLAGRTLLVVLDNVEHLDLVAIVQDLLDAAPGLRLLATSRRRIGVGAEWLLDVTGLAYPDRADGDPERFPAVALFAARARRVRPDFAVADDPESVVRICALVEGLPLALELAADWMRSLRAREVAELIGADLDVLATEHAVVEERQRSMRSVLDASWRLLDPEQQRMLARLSVFRAGFDRDAARAVAGASAGDLARLVDRSVVRPREAARFDLHELLRQFAAEQLADDPDHEQATRARHATHFAALSSSAAGEVTAEPPRSGDAAASLDLDRANLRVAARWLVTHGEEDMLAACLEGVWALDRRGGRYAEALQLLGQALARPDVSPPRAATWHRWAGIAAFQLGRMDRALAELEAAFAALGRPLPRRTPAVVAAIARESTRQGLHRLLPARTGQRDDEAASVETLSLLVNTMYFLQRPLPVVLYALLEANVADRVDDPGAAACAYAELGHVLESTGLRAVGRRYGARADTWVARAPASDLLHTGLETRVMSHLAMAEWDQLDALVASGKAVTASAPPAAHRRRSWGALTGAAALFRGQFGAAFGAFAPVVEEAREVGDDLAFVWCANGMSDALLGLGRAGAAEPVQLEAVERSRRMAAPERLKSETVLAALRLAEHRMTEVLDLARVALVSVQEVRFFPVWALEAYGHLAQVWLALWDAANDQAGVRPRLDAPTSELRRGARLACRQLARFARAYPVGAPRSCWAAGWAAWLDGHERRAAGEWRRSLELAGRLRMPYDAARAHVALADAGAAAAAEHRTEARRLLDELEAHPALLRLRPAGASLTAAAG